MDSPIEQAAVMRALSHPTRIALLEVLQVHDALTATEAGEQIGETSTNCAFHLRALAKIGFVEEVGGGAGRRRPWRLADAEIRFSDVHDDEATCLAANGLSDVLIQHWLNQIAATQAHRHRQPPEWQDVLGGSQATATATPAEIKQLIDDIRELLGRFDNRRDTADLPESARPIQLLLFAQPFHPGTADEPDG